MGTVSIYSPEVRAYALRRGVSELQAYRALKSKAVLQERHQRSLRTLQPVEPPSRPRPGFLQRIFGVSADWNDY